mmetsp:Transcript_35257/g.40224  ORF Transcript_35257/g.40224 Transcript_35257/m.40224 type:complete len:143 (+) Transcript_35257:75-503(+)
MSSPSPPKTAVLQAYRTLIRMISKVPKSSQKESFRSRCRNEFVAPLEHHDTIEDRLKKAGEQVAFLRMISPKSGHSTGENNSGRWIYRDGKRIKDGEATTLDGSRVINGFTGYNFDPCQVKRHSSGLKRAGFVNNLHAKGIF